MNFILLSAFVLLTLQNFASGTTHFLPDLPFLVRISVDGNVTCSGTLIRQNVVLTAGECVFANDRNITVDKSRIAVSLAKTSTMNSTSFSIEKFSFHPNISSNFYENNIALLHLNGSFNLSDLASLPKPEETPTLEGSGVIVNEENGSVLINQVPLMINISVNCVTDDSKTILNSTLQFFAVSKNNSVFHGSLGGPFLSKGKEIQGVLSYPSKACLTRQNGTVFTKISGYISWINEALTEMEKGIDGNSTHFETKLETKLEYVNVANKKAIYAVNVISYGSFLVLNMFPMFNEFF